MKTKDGTIRVGVRKEGDDYLPRFDTAEEAIGVFTSLEHKEKGLEYKPYYVGDTRYENIYSMDYEIECNSCRKVRFITNRNNRHWTQCRTCQDKFRFKVILHYKEDLDVMIDCFTKVIPRGHKLDRAIGFTVVGVVETADEAEWLYKSVGMSLNAMHGRGY